MKRANLHTLARAAGHLYAQLKQDWAKDMKELLLNMKEAVEQARARGQPEVETAVLAGLLTRYEQIVQAGYQINPLVVKPKKSAPLTTYGTNLHHRSNL